MKNFNFIHSEMSEGIIKSYYKVYNTLGFGFLEKVYENSLAVELHRQGFNFDIQHAIDVIYEDHLVGKYYADIIVENLIIVDLKACEVLHPDHEVQLLNYLKATKIEVGLLLNFGHKPQFKRKVFNNDLKPAYHSSYHKKS